MTRSASDSRGITVAVIWRWFWPIALAVVVTVLSWGGGGSEDGVRGLSQALLLLALLYLVVAKLGRRKATWPTIIVLVISFVGLEMLDVIPPAAGLWVIALIVLIWGAVDRQLLRSGAFQVQTLGLIGFGAVSLIGLIIAPDVGRYLVAAGWLLHGAWDLVHLKRDVVVARSFALWCAVFDVGVGVQLILGL